LCFDPHWQREIEGRSLARLGIDPDPTAVHLYDALGDRQAETGPALQNSGGGCAICIYLTRSVSQLM